MLVRFDQPTIRFFRDLRYRPNGTDGKPSPVELSGTIDLTAQGTISQVHVFFGDKMGSQLPEGALTFHTHTVPNDQTETMDMSTDSPSPADLASVALAIVFRGAREHLVFTPHYVYAITLYAETFDAMKQKSAMMSSSELESTLSRELEAKYDELTRHHGQNFGAPFILDWMKDLQNMGINMRRFEMGEDVVFSMGPFESKPVEPFFVGNGSSGVLHDALLFTTLGGIIGLGLWALNRRVK
jgi:hypothetical protein